MWLNELLQRYLGQPPAGRPQPARRRGLRLTLEPLEDRTVPSTFTAASVAELIADINAANLAGGSNTITLVAGKTFTLTGSGSSQGLNGPAGLPVIAANDNLTITGNGNTIERSTANKAPAFRIFGVAAGASLTMTNVTLQGGLMTEGGAIYNQGGLTLSGVTLQNNTAQSFGGAAGGAIFSGGSLTLQDCTVQNNQALGSTGPAPGYASSAACGGGLYVSAGTASLTNVRLYANTAQGGAGTSGGWAYDEYGFKYLVGGGTGGSGLGGGMYVAGGTASLHNTSVDHNNAFGGKGGSSPKGLAKGNDGLGQGGGLFISPWYWVAGQPDPIPVSVCLEAFTQAHVVNNSASTRDPNIAGSYTPCP
jgi:hypothetical protein